MYNWSTDMDIFWEYDGTTDSYIRMPVLGTIIKLILKYALGSVCAIGIGAGSGILLAFFSGV
jgi:hypothetical protein